MTSTDDALLAVEIPYWGQSLLRVLGGIVAVLLPAGTIVYLFLFKMMSFMQSRLGPMEAGPYGSMQLFAEVGKWLQKEDTAPGGADHRIFKMAPLIVLVSTFLLVAVVPFGPDAWFTNFDAGVFYALAVSSIWVLGILMAGWSWANKYSLMGGLRAAGQLIAYELPMVLAVDRRRDPGRHAEHAGHRRRPARRRDLRFDGLGNPYILTQFIGFLDLHGRRAGRADPDAVRHADRRVRARGRLHDRVLGIPVPALLHRRVRHHRRVRRIAADAFPRRLGVPGSATGRPSTTG